MPKKMGKRIKSLLAQYCQTMKGEDLQNLINRLKEVKHQSLYLVFDEVDNFESVRGSDTYALLKKELARLLLVKSCDQKKFECTACQKLVAITNDILKDIAAKISNLATKDHQIDTWKQLWANYRYCPLSRFAETELAKLGKKMPSEDLINQPFISRLTISLYEPLVPDWDKLLGFVYV